MPSGTDTSTESSSDTRASASVAGSASPISRDTGVPPMKLRPKSPTTMPLTNSAYCTGNGRSRPRPARMFCRSCSVTLPAPWLSIRAGSPDMRTAYDTNRVTTSTTKIACRTRFRTNPPTVCPASLARQRSVDRRVDKAEASIRRQRQVLRALVQPVDRVQAVQGHFQGLVGDVAADLLQRLLAGVLVPGVALLVQQRVQLGIVVVRVPALLGVVHRVGGVVEVEGPAAPFVLPHLAGLAVRDDVVQQHVHVIGLQRGRDADGLQITGHGLRHFAEVAVGAAEIELDRR